MTKICSIDWCDRPYRSNGYCKAHDVRARLNKDMNKPFRTKDPSRVCSVPSCQNLYYAKELCNAHYKRRFLRDLTPEQKERQAELTKLYRARCRAEGKKQTNNPDVSHRANKEYERKNAKVPIERKYQPWTLAEERIVIRNDISCREMAYMIHRSVSSVRSRRSLLARGIIQPLARLNDTKTK